MFRTLKRDVGQQFRISRNLNESHWLKCQRAFWATIYLAKALRLACRSMSIECLGSTVSYEGHKRFVSNWAGGESVTLASDGFYREHCERSKITNVLTVSEIAHRFNFGFSFYLGNWYGIDIQKRIYG